MSERERFSHVPDWYLPSGLPEVLTPPFRRVDIGLERLTYEMVLAEHVLLRQNNPFDPNTPAHLGNIPQIRPINLLEALSFANKAGDVPIRIMSTDLLMDVANCGPFGVYNSPLEIGEERENGLFGTSSETTPEILAKTVAVRAYLTFQALQKEGIVFSQENPFTILYLGDGNGTTRQLTSRALEAEHPDLFAVLKNVCVDIGKTSLQRQRERKVAGVREEFYLNHVINMKDLPDRSVFGLVYAYEVLDDLAAVPMRLSADGRIEEEVFFWRAGSFIGNPEPYRDFVSLREGGLASLLEVLFRTFYYQDLNPELGLPVSPQRVMALAEIDRVLGGGTVLLGDYAAAFTLSGEILKKIYQPLRFIFGFSLKGRSEVDYVEDMGSYNLTADVDPFLIHRASQWFGWQPGYFGLYGQYMAQHVSGISSDYAKEALLLQLRTTPQVSAYQAREDFWDTFQAWVKWKTGENPGWKSPAWFKGYLALRDALTALAAFDYQMWAMEMEVPVRRERTPPRPLIQGDEII